MPSITKKRIVFRSALVILLATALTMFADQSNYSKSAAAVYNPNPQSYTCDRITAKGSGGAVGATFVAQVELTVEGKAFSGLSNRRAMRAQSTASVVSQSPPLPNGVLNFVTSHVYEFLGASDLDGACEPGELCFVTLDEAQAIPTTNPTVFRLISSLGIVKGYEGFANLCGKLKSFPDANGYIDFATGKVEWVNTGTFCSCD